MTGLDRLQEIAEDVGRTVWLRDLGAALSEIAGGIGSPDWWSWDLGDAVEALRWVADRGGLDAVKERTMPEGMSWPFYEDGEPVRLGEHWQQDEYDWSITSIDSIEFAEDGVHFENEYADAFYRYGERVKRPAPPVLAADGEPLEVGQTVWLLDDGGRAKCECEVILTRENIGEFSVMVKVAGKYGYSYVRPSSLTHQRPVLDADGVPIREGDKVWLTGEPEYSWTVTYVSERHVGGYCNEDGSSLDMHSKSLTHTKPEIDTWERIEEDLGDEMAKQQCGPISPELACRLAGEFVRRCRALAERVE